MLPIPKPCDAVFRVTAIAESFRVDSPVGNALKNSDRGLDFFVLDTRRIHSSFQQVLRLVF